MKDDARCFGSGLGGVSHCSWLCEYEVCVC